jgi:hypothetical protein
MLQRSMQQAQPNVPVPSMLNPQTERDATACSHAPAAPAPAYREMAAQRARHNAVARNKITTAVCLGD